MRHSTSPRVLTALAVTAVLALAGCSDEPAPEAEAPSYAASGVSARVLPQIAAVGPDTEAADDAAWVVEATVDGAERGTEVELLALDGDEWEAVDTAETNGKGEVVLTTTVGGDLHVVTGSGTDAAGAEVSTDDAPEATVTDDFDDASTYSDEGGEDVLWTTRDQGYIGVRQCSRASADQAEIVDGVMRLGVDVDPARAGEKCQVGKERHDYRVNGHVSTEQTYAFTYGYAAARIKFQPERGQHGAFWLQATGGHQPLGPVDGGTEIDVIEYFGDDHPDGGLTSFTYWLDKNSKKQMRGGWIENPDRYGDNWGDEYHVFSVEWTPEEYVFRIDGQVTHRLKGGTSAVKEFVILSLLSSDYEIKHLNGDLPAHMDVDWVRIWETGGE